MRPLPFLALTLVLAGCGAAPAPVRGPAVVNIPAAPAPAGSAPEPVPAAAPSRNPRAVIADRVNARLQAGGGGHQSVEVEPNGRMVVKDESQHIETELYLSDVDHIDYDNEPGRPQPHFVRLWIKQSGAERTRWRPKGGEWGLSTMRYVVLALGDKHAAEELVQVLRSAVGQ